MMKTSITEKLSAAQRVRTLNKASQSKGCKQLPFVNPEFVSEGDKVSNSAVRHILLAHNGYAYQNRKLNKYKIYAKIQNKSNKNVSLIFTWLLEKKTDFEMLSPKNSLFQNKFYRSHKQQNH